jgi:uncharacterized protein YceK
MTLKSAVLMLIAVGSPALGCASWRSWSHGCPGVYSGVRFSRERMDQVPLDGKIFFALDFPLTAIVDTLALPATAFADPKRPTSGFPPGCRWAS